jgi:hypothetical protein
VSGLSTPLFMAIPIIFIFSGAFPALLTVSAQQQWLDFPLARHNQRL